MSSPLLPSSVVRNVVIVLCHLVSFLLLIIAVKKDKQRTQSSSCHVLPQSIVRDTGKINWISFYEGFVIKWQICHWKLVVKLISDLETMMEALPFLFYKLWLQHKAALCFAKSSKTKQKNKKVTFQDLFYLQPNHTLRWNKLFFPISGIRYSRLRGALEGNIPLQV